MACCVLSVFGRNSAPCCSNIASLEGWGVASLQQWLLFSFRIIQPCARLWPNCKSGAGIISPDDQTIQVKPRHLLCWSCLTHASGPPVWGWISSSWHKSQPLLQLSSPELAAGVFCRVNMAGGNLLTAELVLKLLFSSPFSARSSLVCVIATGTGAACSAAGSEAEGMSGTPRKSLDRHGGASEPNNPGLVTLVQSTV